MAMTREQITRSLGERALSYQIENQRNVSRTGFLSSLSTSYSQTKKPLLEAIEKGTKLTEKIEEEKKERKLYRDIIHTVAADIQRQKDILTQQEKKNLADELRLVIGKLFSTGKATPETVLAATMKLSEFDPVGARKILEELRVDEEFKEMAEMGVGYMETQKEQEAKDTGNIPPPGGATGNTPPPTGSAPPYLDLTVYKDVTMPDALAQAMREQEIYKLYDCEYNYEKYVTVLDKRAGPEGDPKRKIIYKCAYLLNLASTVFVPNIYAYREEKNFKTAEEQMEKYRKNYNELGGYIADKKVQVKTKGPTDDDAFVQSFPINFHKIFADPIEIFAAELVTLPAWGKSILQKGNILPFVDPPLWNNAGTKLGHKHDQGSEMDTFYNVISFIGKKIEGPNFRMRRPHIIDNAVMKMEEIEEKIKTNRADARILNENIEKKRAKIDKASEANADTSILESNLIPSVQKLARLQDEEKKLLEEWKKYSTDLQGTGILPKPKKLIGEVSREDFNALKNGTKKIEDVKIDYFDEATDREMNPERFPETTGGQIQVLDKQEVVDRLHKALAEIKAGNSSRVIRAYIVELADYLLRNKNITKKQYLSIVKMN